MSTTIRPKETTAHGAASVNALDRLVRRLFFQLIEQLETGQIVLVDGDDDGPQSPLLP